MLLLNKVPVGWLSKRQPVTAVSPAEAEVYAMRDVVLAARLMHWVAEDMGLTVQWPLVMKTDSTQARGFQHDNCPKLRGCFDLRDAWVNELREKGVVQTQKIPRKLNLADMMTHCLSRCTYNESVKRAQNFRNHNCKGACVNNYLFSYSAVVGN